MSRDSWHIQDRDGVLTLSRRLPARFDICAETTLPRAGRRRLAQQIRQDLWRALRHLRGLSPVVRITEDGAHLRIEAGGTVQAQNYPKAKSEAALAAVLADPQRRARWLRHAGARA